jgi:glycosyltransferase involved in cell wall biosynthesis
MISIIVPAYNEEKRIRGMLGLYAGYFFERYRDCEFIVVADGSDRTAEIVKEIITIFPSIRLLEYRKRLGKGGGIMEGFRNARGDIMAFVDADESVSPPDLGRVISSLDTADCAIGSRRTPGSRIMRRQPFEREAISRAFNRLVNLMFNLGIRDTQCGAKAFRKEVVDFVLPKIRSNGFEFDVELLWRIKKNGFSVIEVPIDWKHSEHSRFSLKHAPRMFANLMRIRCEQNV